MEIRGARVLIVSYSSWKCQMWLWLDRNQLRVQMCNWTVSKKLAVGACKWPPPTQEGMQARGSKEVNSLLHGYISVFSLSSVPVLLCDTGQVIWICFLPYPVTLYNSQILWKYVCLVFSSSYVQSLPQFASLSVESLNATLINLQMKNNKMWKSLRNAAEYPKLTVSHCLSCISHCLYSHWEDFSICPSVWITSSPTGFCSSLGPFLPVRVLMLLKLSASKTFDSKSLSVCSMNVKAF